MAAEWLGKEGVAPQSTPHMLRSDPYEHWKK